jgi:hypothetical protein
LSGLQLLLVYVSEGVTDDGGQAVVRYIDHLRQWKHLWTELGHAPLHGLLHHAVGAWSEEACVIHGSTILEQLLKAINLAYQLQKVIASRISERVLLAGSTEDVELQVPKVRLSHVILGSVEQLIVFDFWGSLGSVVVAHS